MPKKRTSMTNIKEVLRLKYECGLSIRQIASCTKVSRSTISEIINRFAQGSLQWPLQPQQSESFLNQCIFRDDLASDFGMSRPPISVSSGH